MSPEQAANLQDLLHKAANALEFLKNCIFEEHGEDCVLITDIRAAMAGRFPEDILRDLAGRCEDYFESAEDI